MSAAYMNQYFETQVNTASSEKLLIMLYSGAVRFVDEAIIALREGDIARRGRLIGKTIAILNELSVTLDHEVGGEISANLESLYDYMIRTLLQGNIKDDPESLAEVRELLAGLRETWMRAIEMASAEAPNVVEGVAKKPDAAVGMHRPLAVVL